MSRFVSTAWLASHLADPDVIVVDATWHLPNAGRNARSEFETGHIPGAVHFDIDAIADTRSDLPHMLPDPDTFGSMVGGLGIAHDKTIVVYDEYGLFSAPRVWWSLRVMGAGDVQILDGGGPQWRSEGRALEAGPPNRNAAKFLAQLDTGAIARFDEVLKASADKRQIVDARPATRFTGQTPEPRPGLASGHIPGSINLPFTTLVSDGRLKTEQQLRMEFSKAGIDLEKPIITSCGSGVTAAVIALALDMIGASKVILYDGSWSEWGAKKEAPISRSMS